MSAPAGFFFQGIAIGDNVEDASFALPEGFGSHFRIIGHTNIGKGRDKNQDAASAYLYRAGDIPHLSLMVADGLGFYQYSEKAAYAAVSAIPQLLNEGLLVSDSYKQMHEDLLLGYPYALKAKLFPWKRLRINRLSTKDRGCTTAVCCVIQGSHLTMANAGDSRAYLIRDNRVVFHTRDHTMLEFMVSRGRLKASPSELRRHPMGSVLLNALGVPEKNYQFEEGGTVIELPVGIPVMHQFELEKDDHVLLVTDGIYSNLTDLEMVELIAGTPWDHLEHRLVDRMAEIFGANRTSLNTRPNPDNFTFVVYRH